MKTWLKVSAATVVIGTGVVVYLVSQPTATVNESSATLRPSTRLVDETGGAQGLGAGERPWANQYDEKGQLSYRFRASQYNPLDSGTVGVTVPSFEFYLAGGRRVMLTGETGQVFLPRRSTASTPGSASGGLTGGSSPAVPTRGTMKNVQIKLFDGDGAVPALVALMDNVVFDNDTLRIWTDDAVINGTKLPGNRIPVTIRGSDYDFDGEGLSIQLSNPGDRRIQRLEIAHATRLAIKSTDMLRQRDASAPAGTSPAATPTPVSTGVATAAPAPVAAAPTPAPPPAPGPAAVTPPPLATTDTVYRATIRNKVRIQQGKNTAITGELMQIDFSSAPGKTEIGTATPATPAASPAPSAPIATAPPPAVPNPGAAATPSTPTEVIVPAPANLAPDTSEPIIVTWDGPLRVEADAGDARTPAGQAVATIFGSATEPAQLVQGTSVAKAPAVSYETATRVATLQGSERIPVTLMDDRGSVVTTPLLKYDLAGRVVRMTGASVVRSPVDTDQAGQPRTLLASWSKDAEFRFAAPAGSSAANVGGAVSGATSGLAGLAGNGGGGAGGGRIESAILNGTVRVEHPQLQMTSDSLGLAFESPAGRQTVPPGVVGGSDVREVTATGSVVAQVFEDKGKSPGPRQGIRADRLRLTTARDERGRLFTDKLETSGNVVATDRDQELRSKALVIVMVADPTDRRTRRGGINSGKPQTLSASGDVSARAGDGSVVRAAALTVGNLSSDRIVYIDGPDASVSGQGSTLLANRIVYNESNGQAVINGPGRLNGVQKPDKPGGKESPFSVLWTEGATLDGKANVIDVKGGIVFETVGSDGATATATGKTLRVLLADVPSDRQSRTSNNAASTGTQQTRLLGEKTMKGVELDGQVEIQSILADGAGKVVQQFNLFAERVLYDATGAFNVPVGGRILLIDRRAEPAGSPTPSPSAAEAGMPSGRGNTAMKWSESLRYDPATRKLDFVGAVVFVHDPLSPASTPAAPDAPVDRFRLDADRMTATLGGAAPRTGAPADLSAEQIQSVAASGDVNFAARGVNIRAAELDLDPTAQVIIARGRDRQPVRVDDERGTGTGTFTLARINLKSGQIEDLQNPTGNVGIGGLNLSTTRPSR